MVLYYLWFQTLYGHLATYTLFAICFIFIPSELVFGFFFFSVLLVIQLVLVHHSGYY